MPAGQTWPIFLWIKFYWNADIPIHLHVATVAFTLQRPAWIAGTEIVWPTESTRKMIKRRKRKGMGRRRWKRGGERRRGEARWGGAGQGTGRVGEMEKGLSKRGITEEDTGWLPAFCCAWLLERNNVLALIASQPGRYSYHIKKWEKNSSKQGNGTREASERSQIHTAGRWQRQQPTPSFCDPRPCSGVWGQKAWFVTWQGHLLPSW